MVGEVRGVGLIAAVELVYDKDTKFQGEKPGTLGPIMNKALQRHGVISRAILDSAAFCPPLIIERSQIDEILGAIDKSLADVEKEAGV